MALRVASGDRRRQIDRLALGLVLALAVSIAPSVARAQSFFQRFDSDTSGWINFGNGSVVRVASGASAADGYGDGINSSPGDFHAWLRTNPTANFRQGASGSCVAGWSDCVGPFTDWGLRFTASHLPAGGDSTQVDIYLDTSFAATHPDYRFDWDSALNDSTGQFLQDYVFNVGTGSALPNDPCGFRSTAHFVVTASNSAGREGSYPEDPARIPQCIMRSGWYTFRHEFHADESGTLEVDMSVINRRTGVTVADWSLHPSCAPPQSAGLCSEDQPLPIAAVGGNAFGWFPNQEIDMLPVDNTMLRPLEPQTAADCGKGGWRNFVNPSFRNQNACVFFAELERPR